MLTSAVCAVAPSCWNQLEKAVRARFAARFDPTCASQWHVSLPIAVDFAAQIPVLSLRSVQCELNEVDQVVIFF
jgi:hypothetical protein